MIGKHNGRKVIVLDKEDARFVLMELEASCPRDGFTKDLRLAVDLAWPDESEVVL